MNRQQATLACREELNKHGLSNWYVRLTTNVNHPFLGLCSYKDKAIILNAHHIDIHPEPDVINTIKHEVAHALCPGHGHDSIWQTMAKDIGCDNVAPCSTLSFTPEIIDAIRSGADIEVTFDEQVIRKPKYQVTRLQDRCPECGKVAKELFSFDSTDKDGNDVKMITLECFHIIKRIIPKATPFDKLVFPAIINGPMCEKEHAWVGNKCDKCGAFRPYQFQVDGMRFIERALSMQRGAAVFDEMGLGKTIQALGYIKFHPEACPVLYIVKSGIKFQWFKEIIRILGPEYMAQVISTSKDFIMPGLKSYIVPYDLLVPKSRTNKNGKIVTSGLPLEKLEPIGIKTIVLDECQQIKNPDSSRTQMVRRLASKAEKVIPLSGTPWKNRGSEFFTVLNMLAPTKFYSYKGFVDRWVEQYMQGNQWKEGGIRNPEKFKEYIQDIAIRRERSEVMKELPIIGRALHYIELEKVDQINYDNEVSDFVKWYNQQIIDGNEDGMWGMGGQPAIAKLQRMRHIVALSKIPATMEFTREFIEETDRKLVIFVHHKDVGSILYDNCVKEFGDKIKVMKLTAELTSEERFNVQEEFNKSPRAIMIASTLASGEGLNLQTCADCIMHERQWNPANEEQAEGRFIRIGQVAQAVNATYVTATGTVDEHLAAIVERKRVDFHNAMNRGEMPVWRQGDIVKELAEAIVKDWNKKNRGK